MIVGAAGHIDHGKTALIKALTDADRLDEETRQGTTTDFGFACMPVEGGRAVGFIDVPGHERFIHNMLAGIAGVDFGLLVVDAREGPKQQTFEHLQILGLLGVQRGVVALNKCDLVGPDRIVEASAEVQAMLKGSGLARAEIVPVSALTGEGVDALGRIIREAAAQSDGAAQGENGAARTANGAGRFRLAVDGSFSLSGAGTMVTGTVFGGSVHVGDTVTLSPADIELRVCGLHVQGQPAVEARKGDRCALDLSGPGFDKDAARRGDWILAPRLHAPVTCFDARLRLLADERRAFHQWTPVSLHLAASHVGARVALLEGAPLEPGGEAFVQIAADQPIGALHGDRFVIRDRPASSSAPRAPARTIGGGCVLDPFPTHRGRRRPERLAILAAEAQGDLAHILAVRLALPPHWLDLDQFMLAHNVTDVLPLAVDGSNSVVRAGAFVIERGAWEEMKREVLERLEAFHEAYPGLPGIHAERLAPTLPWRPPLAALLALLKELAREGAAVPEGPWWRLSRHSPSLGSDGEKVWAAAELRLGEQRFCPPRVRDLGRELGVPEERMRELMKQLVRLGRVIEVAPDHFFLREAVAELAGCAEELGAEAQADGGWFKAAAFRDRIGIGRKVAIQILEFLDRQGATVRNGDLRRAHPSARSQFAAPPQD